MEIWCIPYYMGKCRIDIINRIMRPSREHMRDCFGFQDRVCSRVEGLPYVFTVP